ncbi:hypothetical protein D3C76_1631300 [compost metagenome]
MTISLFSKALTLPSLPMKACAVGRISALVRWLSGRTSVAASVLRLNDRSREASRGRSGMSMISAGGVDMMANL